MLRKIFPQGCNYATSMLLREMNPNSCFTFDDAVKNNVVSEDGDFNESEWACGYCAQEECTLRKEGGDLLLSSYEDV